MWRRRRDGPAAPRPSSVENKGSSGVRATFISTGRSHNDRAARQRHGRPEPVARFEWIRDQLAPRAVRIRRTVERVGRAGVRPLRIISRRAYDNCRIFHSY